LQCGSSSGINIIIIIIPSSSSTRRPPLAADLCGRVGLALTSVMGGNVCALIVCLHWEKH